MDALIDKTGLRCLLMAGLPEVRPEFSALPDDASLYSLLNKLAEVTFILAHQKKFKAVRRCLMMADRLMLDGNKSVSTAVSTVYVHYLSILLDKRNASAEMIHYLLPRALRAEYTRQITACLP